jgi:FkbM family methyltransferase
MKKKIQQIKNKLHRHLTNLLFYKYISQLDENDVAIDCGANVGEITEKLAHTGAKVYAFEPNQYAFKTLKERVGKYKNVICIPKGVWHMNTSIPLYFHREAENDNEFWSFGSSIVKEKDNVNGTRFETAEIIDLTEFIGKIESTIGLLKIDIEGAECELLEKFINQNLHEKVKITLVETHNSKIPGQKVKTDAIRRLIKERKITNIKLNWL